LKELSEAQDSKSISNAVESALLDEVNALKEANGIMEIENSGLRKQLLALASTSDEFAETLRKQIQSLITENAKRHDQSGIVALAEINEALCAEIDRVKARLLAYEQGKEIPLNLSDSEVPELLGRYQKLGKRFTAVTKVSEHLNQFVDSAHQRNRELETEVASLRAENLSLTDRLREKDRTNRKLLHETGRVLADHAKVLSRLDQ
jgi:hypothetical protein